MMGGGTEIPKSRTHRRNNNGSWSTSLVSMGGVVRLCHYDSKAVVIYDLKNAEKSRNGILYLSSAKGSLITWIGELTGV
ncbi:adenylate/guanylate cyclase domain-containing protein [Sesbania bispinosa]|nr:adenylate/guanylate cyclase domain-containing protein [Sesbania bispinosa]